MYDFYIHFFCYSSIPASLQEAGQRYIEDGSYGTKTGLYDNVVVVEFEDTQIPEKFIIKLKEENCKNNKKPTNLSGQITRNFDHFFKHIMALQKAVGVTYYVQLSTTLRRVHGATVQGDINASSTAMQMIGYNLLKKLAISLSSYCANIMKNNKCSHGSINYLMVAFGIKENIDSYGYMRYERSMESYLPELIYPGYEIKPPSPGFRPLKKFQKIDKYGFFSARKKDPCKNTARSSDKSHSSSCSKLENNDDDDDVFLPDIANDDAKKDMVPCEELLTLLTPQPPARNENDSPTPSELEDFKLMNTSPIIICEDSDDEEDHFSNILNIGNDHQEKHTNNEDILTQNLTAGSVSRTISNLVRSDSNEWSDWDLYDAFSAEIATPSTSRESVVRSSPAESSGGDLLCFPLHGRRQESGGNAYTKPSRACPYSLQSKLQNNFRIKKIFQSFT